MAWWQLVLEGIPGFTPRKVTDEFYFDEVKRVEIQKTVTDTLFLGSTKASLPFPDETFPSTGLHIVTLIRQVDP